MVSEVLPAVENGMSDQDIAVSVHYGISSSPFLLGLRTKR